MEGDGVVVGRVGEGWSWGGEGWSWDGEEQSAGSELT